MDDIRFPVYGRDNLQDRSCEKREPFRVVIVAVDSVSFKIILVVKKIEDNAVQFRFKNAAVLSSPAYGNRNGSDKLHFILIFLFDRIIKRHNHTAADQSFSERDG